MSPPKGPLEAIVTPFAEQAKLYATLPPYERAVARAEYGAFLLGVSGYVGLTVGVSLPGSWLIALTVIGGYGLLLLATGSHDARGRRDVMSIFWSLVVIGGGWWVVTHWLPDLWADFYGRTFCIGALCSTAVRLYLALRGLGHHAHRLVTEDIAAQEWKW